MFSNPLRWTSDQLHSIHSDASFKSTTIGIKPMMIYRDRTRDRHFQIHYDEHQNNHLSVRITHWDTFKSTTVGLRRNLESLRSIRRSTFKFTTVGIRHVSTHMSAHRQGGFKSTTVGIKRNLRGAHTRHRSAVSNPLWWASNKLKR